MDPCWDVEPTLCFTVDVDWASEEAIQCADELLAAHGIRPTYFATHLSQYLVRRQQAGLADLGIHPNFLPGSSHGESYDEVMDYCLSLVPGAQCFRSHRYFDVTDITHGLYARGLRYDANVCALLHTGLRPFRHESGLMRFPTYFEDGTYLYHQRDLNFANAALDLLGRPGLMIIAIHPMHMALNSPDLPYSRRVKDSVSRAEWSRMSGETLKRLRHNGRGIRDFVADMLDYVIAQRFRVETLHHLYLMSIRELPS